MVAVLNFLGFFKILQAFAILAFLVLFHYSRFLNLNKIQVTNENT